MDEFRANSFFAMLISKAKPIINLTEPDAEVTDADDFSDDECYGDTDDPDVDELMMMKIRMMMNIIVFDSLKYHSDTLTIQYDGARGVIFEYCLVGSLFFE